MSTHIKRCCIPDCKETSENKTVVFHKFPSNKSKADKWLTAVKGVYLDQNKLVCQKHFESRFITEKLRLKANAYPSLFTENEITTGIPSSSVCEQLEDITFVDHSYSKKAHVDHSYYLTLEKEPIQSTSKIDILNPEKEPEKIVYPSKDSITETPKKVKRKLIQTSYTLSPKCKMLYKAYKKTKKQVLYTKSRSMKSKPKALIKRVTSKVNPIAQQFIKMQIRLSNTKQAKGRRFTLEEKMIALSIQKQGPKCYRFLKKIFILPSETTLKKLVGSLNIEPGINPQIFNLIKEEVVNWKQEKKYCSIIFDEMALEPELTFTPGKDRINGFVHLNERKNNLADHALAFMIKGAVYKWQQPIAFYFCEGATSTIELKEILKQIVTSVCDAGLIPIALISDQGSTFQSALKSLQQETRRNIILEGKNSTDPVICMNGLNLSVIYDPPHLIKGLRNNFLSKNISFDGKISKWSDIVDVYKTDCNHADARLLHKLNDEHVIPGKIKKMKVKNCVRVLSKTVAGALSYTSAFSHYTDGRPVSKTMKNTAEMVNFFDDLFDSVIGSKVFDSKSKKELRTAVTINSPHKNFWIKAKAKLTRIKFMGKNNKLSSVPTIKNWLTTLDSFQRIWDIFKEKNLKIMRPRNFNSDCIENLFGQIRAYNARNVNPSCHQFISTFKSLLISGFIKFHNPNFNCEESSGEQLLKIKKLFEPTDVSPPIVRHNETLVKPANSSIDVGADFLTKVRRERLSVHSRAYTAGWALRKCLNKNCKQCRKDTLSVEKENIHKWISAREYKSKNMQKLKYPSEQIVMQFGNIFDECNKFLEINAHQVNIFENIKKNIIKNCNFEFLKCEEHRTMFMSDFIQVTAALAIYNWCNIINKILRGVDVVRLEGRDLPFMQKRALIKLDQRYKKRSKKAILKQTLQK